MSISMNKQIFILPSIIILGVSIPVCIGISLSTDAIGTIGLTILSVITTALISSIVLNFQIVLPIQAYINDLYNKVSDAPVQLKKNHAYHSDKFRKKYSANKRYQFLADKIDSFYDTTTNLSDNGSSIAIASVEISFTADKLEQKLHEEVDCIQDIANSAEHISTIVAHSADITLAASQSADETLNASKQGHDAISEAVQQMQMTNEQAHQTAEYVISLTQKSKQIEQITSVIRAIAEQTNLLALNAAIEAARAGEQGRGFAVVADEVRILAHKTSEATDEIGSMVNEIGSSIQQSESTMNQLTSSIEEGALKTSAVGQHLESIATHSKSMQQQMSEITKGMTENTQEVKQISGAIEQVNSHLITTESEVSGVAKEAQKLSEMAETIHSFILIYDKKSIHSEMRKTAEQAANTISSLFETSIANGKISQSDLFDQKYVPIDGTNPLKHSTQFDKFTDQVLPEVQEPLLKAHNEITFAGAVDINGYFPTHNIKYSQPLTGNYQTDLVNNRTKRIFNDPTGLRCGTNTNAFLLQTYKRDTGEVMHDISVPIMVNNKHWGGFRMGYQAKN